jgi:hypothetical protein
MAIMKDWAHGVALELNVIKSLEKQKIYVRLVERVVIFGGEVTSSVSQAKYVRINDKL